MKLNGVVRLDHHQSYRVKCMPGKLRSPQIMSRSTVSIPRVARSEPNSSKNIDLLAEGGGRCWPKQCPGMGDPRPIFAS